MSTTTNRMAEILSKRTFSTTLDRMQAKVGGGEVYTSPDAVKQRIHKRLDSLVSLPKSQTEYPNFRELVFAFEADWKLLEGYRQEWMQLLQAVIRFTPDGSRRYGKSMNRDEKRIADDWRFELLSGLAWPLSIQSQLEARLAPLPLCESQRTLSNNVTQTVKAMAEHMTYQLNTLVDRCVLGQIAWYGEDACQYSFVDRDLHSLEYQTGYRGEIKLDYGKQIASRTEYTTASASKQVSVHRHDLVDAVYSPISLAMAAIPEPVRQVIDKVPSFMQDELKMVEGNLIRGRCIRQDQGVGEWTVLQDITVPYHFDPAIVLVDRYVLIGWLENPSEVDSAPVSSLSALFASAVNRLFK